MKHKITRRHFIKIIAATGAALAIGFPALEKSHLVSKSRVMMGTIVNLVLVGSDRVEAERAATTCLEEMSVLEKILSRHHSDSQLSLLNQTGLLNNPHQSIQTLIQQSKQISQLSGGAFDITIKPVLDLYQEASKVPDENLVRKALSLVDYKKMILEDDRVYFTQPGMSITLDGIAKGFIVDEGIFKLKQAGFGNVMVEAGGDLSAAGNKKPNSPWTIGLQDPRSETGRIMARVKIRDQALATSGDYMQAYTPDLTNHHIIDPRRGYSPTELASVSVTAPTTSRADALATTVMVMGRSGLQVIEGLDSCEAFVVTKEGVMYKSSGFQEV